MHFLFISEYYCFTRNEFKKNTQNHNLDEDYFKIIFVTYIALNIKLKITLNQTTKTISSAQNPLNSKDRLFSQKCSLFPQN